MPSAQVTATPTAPSHVGCSTRCSSQPFRRRRQWPGVALVVAAAVKRQGPGYLLQRLPLDHVGGRGDQDRPGLRYDLYGHRAAKRDDLLLRGDGGRLGRGRDSVVGRSRPPRPCPVTVWPASNGQVFGLGKLPSLPSLHPASPVVAMASTPGGYGYWLVLKNGAVLADGNAHLYGSMSGKRLNSPIAGMAATPDGRGYWLVAADGGIFAFGDAHYYGSLGARSLHQPIAGIAADP